MTNFHVSNFFLNKCQFLISVSWPDNRFFFNSWKYSFKSHNGNAGSGWIFYLCMSYTSRNFGQRSDYLKNKGIVICLWPLFKKYIYWECQHQSASKFIIACCQSWTTAALQASFIWKGLHQMIRFWNQTCQISKDSEDLWGKCFVGVFNISLLQYTIYKIEQTRQTDFFFHHLQKSEGHLLSSRKKTPIWYMSATNYSGEKSDTSKALRSQDNAPTSCREKDNRCSSGISIKTFFLVLGMAGLKLLWRWLCSQEVCCLKPCCACAHEQRKLHKNVTVCLTSFRQLRNEAQATLKLSCHHLQLQLSLCYNSLSPEQPCLFPIVYHKFYFFPVELFFSSA